MTKQRAYIDMLDVRIEAVKQKYNRFKTDTSNYARSQRSVVLKELYTLGLVRELIIKMDPRMMALSTSSEFAFEKLVNPFERSKKNAVQK
jgi:hypothetical protein